MPSGSSSSSGSGSATAPVGSGMEKIDMAVVEDMTNANADDSGLKRDLHLRHMVMIAISGTIGTGLFMTSGKTVSTAGPLGARKSISSLHA